MDTEKEKDSLRHTKECLIQTENLIKSVHEDADLLLNQNPNCGEIIERYRTEQVQWLSEQVKFWNELISSKESRINKIINS